MVEKRNEVFGGKLTEKITQAEALASNPFLVIDSGLLEVIIPTQGIPHCVILVSFCTSWKKDKYKKKKKKKKVRSSWSPHSQFLLEFGQSRKHSQRDRERERGAACLEYSNMLLIQLYFLYISPSISFKLQNTLSLYLSVFLSLVAIWLHLWPYIHRVH